MPGNSYPLPLSDLAGVVRRDALEIMALDPERHAEALTEASDGYAALAEVDGCSPVDAAIFALKMRHLIEEAMRAIEADGKATRSQT